MNSQIYEYDQRRGFYLQMFKTNDKGALSFSLFFPPPFLSLSPLPVLSVCVRRTKKTRESERERDSHRPRNPAKLEKTEEKPESHLYIHSFGKTPLPFSLIFRIGFLGFSVKLEGIEPNLRIHVFVVHWVLIDWFLDLIPTKNPICEIVPKLIWVLKYLSYELNCNWLWLWCFGKLRLLYGCLFGINPDYVRLWLKP